MIFAILWAVLMIGIGYCGFIFIYYIFEEMLASTMPLWSAIPGGSAVMDTLHSQITWLPVIIFALVGLWLFIRAQEEQRVGRVWA